MFGKHFFKILIGFAGMILIGLLGLFFIDYFDTTQNKTAGASSATVNQ